MKDIPKCPPLSQELIDYLNATVPEKCPDPRTPDREIWMYSGKRELVRGLIAQFHSQQENILEAPLHVYQAKD